MDILSLGTDDIILETGQSIGSINNQAVTSQPYTNQTVAYNENNMSLYLIILYLIIFYFLD